MAIFTQSPLKQQGMTVRTPWKLKWQHLPCANHNVNWVLCARIVVVFWVRLTFYILEARLEVISCLALTPFLNVWDSWYQNIQQLGKKKKPDSDPGHRGALSWAALDPTTVGDHQTSDCLSRSTSSRGHEPDTGDHLFFRDRVYASFIVSSTAHIKGTCG